VKIIINNKLLDFDNKEENINKIFETINSILTESELELSCLIIDGKPVKKEFYQYFKENIQTIREVVVEVITVGVIVNETLDSACKYIEDIILLIKPLSEEFYQLPKQNSWQDLANLFEGMQWLMETVNRIDSFNHLERFVSDYGIWNEYVQIIKSLSDVILELEGAMVNQDHVLIGDLLQYEILPIFEQAEEKLIFLSATGGNHRVS
jgi:hypothetical protein